MEYRRSVSDNLFEGCPLVKIVQAQRSGTHPERMLYHEGKGVKPNNKTAIARMREAASLGFKEAEKKLLELDDNQ